MNPPNGEETIFAEAQRLEPGQRAAYLDLAVGGDVSLRRRIEALLGAYEDGDFLELAAAPRLCETVDFTPPITEQPGDTIGRYKLLQQIGEGGCGVVYMAEQSEPVRRRVALKIIKLGMDTKSVIARFEAERQALAMMDHPNIAKVLDAGATETGRPYFVMELVRGMKLTEYCDEKKLSTQERLHLFIQVCQAIQHAHQKGIIHRDIKPSNILVTVNDGVAVPKVIDFGIAKATSGQQLTDKTLFTAFEQFIGTPAYMSPEQAMLTSLDIDTRSDIYALGVLLYELLTGKTPFDAQELLAIGLDEMRRTIREREPAKPSTRLSSLAGQDLSTTAQRRGLEAPKLISELRGDLDWIVMKALEKDRTRRYETANGLASDIQRHLENEPVVACPPGKLYRFRKMVRRNRLAVTAAAAVIAALIAGAGIATWMFFKERDARTRAVAAEQTERKLRREAELREQDARAMHLSIDTADLDAALDARRKVIEAQRKEFGNDDPRVAQSLTALAVLFAIHKNLPAAVQAMREALAIRKKISPEGDSFVVGESKRLGRFLMDQRKFKEAEEVFREALKVSRKVYGDENPETAVVIANVTAALTRQGRMAEALPLCREAYATCRKSLPDGNPKLALTASNLLVPLIALGHLSEAVEFAREVVPPNEAVSPRLMEHFSRLVTTLISQGRAAEAEELLDDLVSRAPGSRTILRKRAEYRASRGRWNDAVDDFIRLTESRPGETEYRPESYDWVRLSALLIQSGDLRGYRERLRKCVERFGPAPDSVLAHCLSKSCSILPDSGIDPAMVNQMADIPVAGESKSGNVGATKALTEYRQGRFEKAAEWAEKTAVHESRPGWVTMQSYATLAMARHRLKQEDLAQKALARAREDAEDVLPRIDCGNFGSGWAEAIITHTLLGEAEKLIEGRPQTTSGTR